MIQLILHLVGDYITQSDWMAQNKTKADWPAACHAFIYSLPFLLIVDSALAMFVICSTHYLIDRYRLARYAVWAKNVLFQPGLIYATWHWKDISEHHAVYPYEVAQVNLRNKWRWSNCSTTGYPSDAPPWLAVWLLIAADNTIHLAINASAIAFL